jgi:hypothetical protein
VARHKADHHVVQYFTATTLRAQCQAAGFHVIEVSPIMTGEFARREFEGRIRNHKFARSLWSRPRFTHRLREEDRHSTGQEGIMLVARMGKG